MLVICVGRCVTEHFSCVRIIHAPDRCGILSSLVYINNAAVQFYLEQILGTDLFHTSRVTNVHILATDIPMKSEQRLGGGHRPKLPGSI